MMKKTLYDKALQNTGCRREEQLHRIYIWRTLTVFATVCMICICAFSYHSIRTNASSGFKYYTSVTVESGDTLWKLAEEYIDYNYYKNRNSYISEVRSINHLDENCSIKQGQVLIFPYYSSEYIP